MITMSSVPTYDWVALTIGLIGVVLGYVQSKDKLPKWAREWLNRIGPDNIESAVEYAAKLTNMTAEQRRDAAVTFLMRFADQELGLVVSKSIANLLVEYVYQQWKRR